jgi:hypothetical protein
VRAEAAFFVTNRECPATNHWPSPHIQVRTFTIFQKRHGATREQTLSHYQIRACPQICRPNLSQTPVGFGIDRLQERLQLPKDFLRRVDALNATQTREQSRNLAPMTLGQLPFDVPLFVNQASLNHTVADELFHSGAQHGTRGGLLEEVGQGWFL